MSRAPRPDAERRALLRGLCAGAALLPLVSPSWAFARDRVIDRRLELWRNYARDVQNLVATLTTTRESSLYADGTSRSASGTLIFVAPDRLLMHDDDLEGSTTLIEGDRCSILTNSSRAKDSQDSQDSRQRTKDEDGPLDPSPALRWLAAHLVGAFAPPPADVELPTAFERGARLSRPRGAGIRLTVLPPRDSPVRRIYRSMTISLAPTSGAVERIELAESAGDRLILELSDHQKNLDPAAVAEALRAVDPHLI